jgi:hypothetical protein
MEWDGDSGKTDQLLARLEMADPDQLPSHLPPPQAGAALTKMTSLLFLRTLPVPAANEHDPSF